MKWIELKYYKSEKQHKMLINTDKIIAVEPRTDRPGSACTVTVEGIGRLIFDEQYESVKDRLKERAV